MSEFCLSARSRSARGPAPGPSPRGRRSSTGRGSPSPGTSCSANSSLCLYFSLTFGSISVILKFKSSVNSDVIFLHKIIVWKPFSNIIFTGIQWSSPSAGSQHGPWSGGCFELITAGDSRRQRPGPGGAASTPGEHRDKAGSVPSVIVSTVN